MATAEAESRTSAANSLLRGERSSVETYEMALSRFEPDAGREEVSQILSEHRDSVRRLEALVREEGGEPAGGSGMWGYWAGMVTGLARLIGPGATLQALYRGEEHGKTSYESALNDDTVPQEVKDEVRARLLPRQLQHLLTLNDLIQRQK